MYGIDVLEADGPLTKHDYEFLSGLWKGSQGAAMNIVEEWCHNKGLGGYGAPTEKGLKAMRAYEDYDG
jgi:hypothetical protein